MGDTARQLARNYAFALKDSASAYYYLASAGLETDEIIKDLPIAMKFATAGNLGLETGTRLLTQAQKALGLSIKGDVNYNMQQMARVADVLVMADKKATATTQQFAEALTNRAGAALRLLHKDITEGASVLAIFAKQNLMGAAAGTQLDMLLRDLGIKANKNAAVFQHYGIQVYDSAGKMRNLADITADLERAFTGMSDKQVRATLSQLGFTYRSGQAIQMLIGYSSEMKELQKAFENAGGTVDKVVNKQLDTFSKQLEITINKIKDMAVSLAGPVVNAFKDALKSINDTNGPLEKLAQELADLPGPVRGLVSGLAVATVGIGSIGSVAMIATGFLVRMAADVKYLGGTSVIVQALASTFGSLGVVVAGLMSIPLASWLDGVYEAKKRAYNEGGDLTDAATSMWAWLGSKAVGPGSAFLEVSKGYSQAKSLWKTPSINSPTPNIPQPRPFLQGGGGFGWEGSAWSDPDKEAREAAQKRASAFGALGLTDFSKQWKEGMAALNSGYFTPEQKYAGILNLQQKLVEAGKAGIFTADQLEVMMDKLDQMATDTGVKAKEIWKQLDLPGQLSALDEGMKTYAKLTENSRRIQMDSLLGFADQIDLLSELDDITKGYNSTKQQSNILDTHTLSLMGLLNNMFVKGKSHVEQMEAKFKELGLTSSSSLRLAADKANKIFEEIVADAASSEEDILRAWVKSIQAAIEAGEKLDPATLKQYRAIRHTVDDSLNEMEKGWKHFSREVSTVFTDMSREIAEVIFEAKDFGEAMRDIAKSIGKAILREIIEQGFMQILKWLKLVSKDTKDWGEAIDQVLGKLGKAAKSIWDLISGKKDKNQPGITDFISAAFGDGSGGFGFPGGGYPGQMPGGGGGMGGGGGITGGAVAAGATIGGLVGGPLGAGIGAGIGLVGGAVTEWLMGRGQQKDIAAVEQNTRYAAVQLISIQMTLNTWLPAIQAVHQRLAELKDLTQVGVISMLERIHEAIRGGVAGGGNKFEFNNCTFSGGASEASIESAFNTAMRRFEAAKH
jgi:TP901 family phage tail tape measure protein